MNFFAKASFYLTAVLASSPAIIGEARLLSKSGKSYACREALKGFNLAGEINYGSSENGYLRTMCAGDTFLLTNPEKKSEIYEHMCSNDVGFAGLDIYVQQADDAGGCHHPVAGQPSRALGEYRKCRDDAEVATNMVCTDAGTGGDLCWSVMYQLTKEVCWNSNFTEPALDAEECLPLDIQTETVNGEEVHVQVTCECLHAYLDAYGHFSSDGLASFGADEDTLALVQNRLSMDCRGTWD